MEEIFKNAMKIVILNRDNYGHTNTFMGFSKLGYQINLYEHSTHAILINYDYKNVIEYTGHVIDLINNKREEFIIPKKEFEKERNHSLANER